MKSRLIYVAATAFIMMVLSLELAAQEQHHHWHHHYKLIDIGTFGGPKGWLNHGGDNGAFANAVGNNRGAFTGFADTSEPDPLKDNPGFCFTDCYVNHAFQWQNGVRKDLGVLLADLGFPKDASSATAWISPNGLIAGTAQNGVPDPLDLPWIQERAVLWQNNQIVDLGTLPEGGYESGSAAINSSGQVTGWAITTNFDAYSYAFISNTYFPYEFYGSYQTRAFLWQNGVMHNLGTLGGPDAFPVGINERGQVIGFSYTNAPGSPDNNGCTTPTTGVPPATDPFFWDKDAGMIDIGTLGGTCGSPYLINNRGQVVGASNLAGDQVTHAFLWERETGIFDLGTLGGTDSVAFAINDAGVIVGGFCCVEGDALAHTFLWDGNMHDLGVVPGTNCSFPFWINARGQIVGIGGNDCYDGFLWEDGGPMVDLNTLVSNKSGFSITAPGGQGFAGGIYINDNGEIFGRGIPAGCNDAAVCGHDFVLIPCDENHPGIEGCDYSRVDATPAAQVLAPVADAVSGTTNENSARILGLRDWLDGRLSRRQPHSPKD